MKHDATIIIHNGLLYRAFPIDAPEADLFAQANGHQYVERLVSEEPNGILFHITPEWKIKRRTPANLDKLVVKTAMDSVNKRMDEIYNNIADTLLTLSKAKKYQILTGPEALLTCSKLIRRAPKEAKTGG